MTAIVHVLPETTLYEEYISTTRQLTWKHSSYWQIRRWQNCDNLGTCRWTNANKKQILWWHLASLYKRLMWKTREWSSRRKVHKQNAGFLSFILILQNPISFTDMQQPRGWTDQTNAHYHSYEKSAKQMETKVLNWQCYCSSTMALFNGTSV